MKLRNYIKIIIIFVAVVMTLLSLTKDSYASNPVFIGFIIEAKQMEGTLESPSIIQGQTSSQLEVSMLQLKFSDLNVDGLTIKKFYQTPNGNITVTMDTANEIQFTDLIINLTNVEFNETYNPSVGNIGLKNVKLLAHEVKTSNLSIPKLQIHLNDGGQTELVPKISEELTQIKLQLDSILTSPQQ